MSNGFYQQNSPTQQLPRQGRYNPHYQQPQFQQQPHLQYQQYEQHQMLPHNNTTTTGQWVLTLFLMCIPIVNIILLFVWAFGSGTESSKQNWARANLIWMLVGILFIVLLVVAASFMGFNPRELANSY